MDLHLFLLHTHMAESRRLLRPRLVAFVVLFKEGPLFLRELLLDLLDDFLKRYAATYVWVSLEVADEVFVPANRENVSKDNF